MPVYPFGVKIATLHRNPRSGNPALFSNGQNTASVKMWEVWNSRYRRGTVPQSKVYGEETVCVLRSHDKLSGELRTDDAVSFGGYKYSVQSVHPVETPLGINRKDYEVALK